MDGTFGKEFIVTDYARRLIRHKAQKLSRHALFRPADVEDVHQELWLAIVKQARRFNAERAALDTFIDRIVKSAVAMLVRDRRRYKRAGNFQTLSLSVEFSTGGKEAWAAHISEADHLRRLGVDTQGDIQRHEQAEAVAAAFAAMSPQLRDFCRQVIVSSVSAAARHQHLSRRQVRRALVAVRSFLLDVGFFEL